jgi:RHS repeat-associated protein
MGQPGAKKLDQIVSLTPGDIHLIQPPGPSPPVPVPHPVPNSLIKDDVAEKVKVMGFPGAVKGSVSQHTPPHIPIGGTFVNQPSNKGKITTGSANVFYEGKEAAMLGDTAEMCMDPKDAPVGMVIGKAATVLVGGGSLDSGDPVIRAAAQARLAAVSNAMHAWINATMPPGSEREKAHRDVCNTTGHPIDVATGKLITKNVDLKLPGRIPFEFTRNYSSARSDLGAFGHSWRHSYEAQLIVHKEFIAHRDHNGRFLEFEPIAVGSSAWNQLGRLTLRRSSDGYSVEDFEGLRQFFSWSGTATEEAAILSLRQVSDRFDNRIRFEHTNGRLSRITDSSGRIIILDYNEHGFISTLKLIPDPLVPLPQILWSYTYSSEDDLIEARDNEGNVRRFAYANHLLVQEMDRTGFSFYFTYDKEGWCQETWGGAGILYRRLYYDRQKRVTRVLDSLGYFRIYAWNELGVVTRETDHLGNTWSTRYNGSLQAVRREDPLGNAWEFDYDDRGRLVAALNPEGNGASFKWSIEGQLLEYVDQAGNKWQIEYGHPHFKRLIDPSGHTTIEYRNDHGDLIRISHADGTETKCAYDDSGNAVGIINPSGSRISRQYNEAGDLLIESDAVGPKLRITYDSLRRPVCVARRGKGEIKFNYDPENRIVRIADAKDRATDYEYTAFNQLKRVVQPKVRLFDGSTLTRVKCYTYDTENRVTSVTTPGGGVVEYEYGAGSRPLRLRYPDNRTQTYERDARGFVAKLFENGILVFEQQSDSQGRVTRRFTGDGKEFRFEYDPFGNLILAASSDKDTTVEIDRDPLGNVVSERGPLGLAGFTQTKPGDDVHYSWSEELQLIFRFTAVHSGKRLSAFRSGSEEIRLEFDEEDRLRLAQFSSGESQTLEYGTGRQPLQRQVVGPREKSTREDFAYDANGWLETVLIDGSDKRNYQRDEADRLTTMITEKDGQSRHYLWGYDSSDNRVLMTDAQGQQLRLNFSPGQRPVQVGEDRLAYDERGRVISIRDGKDKITHYVWDVMGRLMEVKLPNGENVKMRYDALGRRIEKESCNGSTRFGWLGNRMVYERLPAKESRHYVYRPNSFGPLACYVRRFDDEYRLHAYRTDLRGAPVCVTNEKSEIVWEGDLGPWGESAETATTSEFNQSIALPGQYRDVETGLHYNYNRYYLPRAGLYLSPDPAGLAGGDSPYAYVSDPVCWLDPMGLMGDDYEPKTTKDAAGNTVPKVENVTDFDSARRLAFERAGLTDPSKVQATKFDETGTAVEFKGPGGAKVAYDSPHADDDAAAGHDKPHVGWQTAGKRRSGEGGRGNITYDGPQGPARSDSKD